MFLTAVSESRSDPENQIVSFVYKSFRAYLKKTGSNDLFNLFQFSYMTSENLEYSTKVAFDAYVVPIYNLL